MRTVHCLDLGQTMRDMFCIMLRCNVAQVAVVDAAVEANDDKRLVDEVIG